MGCEIHKKLAVDSEINRKSLVLRPANPFGRLANLLHLKLPFFNGNWKFQPGELNRFWHSARKVF
jgi:hypothetical protein